MSITMVFDSTATDGSPFHRFSWTRAAVAWADGAGPVVRDALKHEAPAGKGPRAGRLRDSIRYERATSMGSGAVTASFTANVPYAGYVLDGTRPHLISARAARALHWAGPDGDMFARHVSHPGTKPNPFNERALAPLTPWLREQFQAAVIDSMEGL